MGKEVRFMKMTAFISTAGVEPMQKVLSRRQLPKRTLRGTHTGPWRTGSVCCRKVMYILLVAAALLVRTGTCSASSSSTSCSRADIQRARKHHLKNGDYVKVLPKRHIHPDFHGMEGQVTVGSLPSTGTKCWTVTTPAELVIRHGRQQVWTTARRNDLLKVECTTTVERE